MTTTDPCRVDVLVPVFNGSATIEGALRSILSQTCRALRLIVVDDGSTDATPDILARLAAEDRRVVVVTTANAGIVDALNTALAHSTAAYVARHDADDLAFPERIAQQVAYLDAHPECAAVSGNAFHIDAAGRRTGHRTAFGLVTDGDPFNAPSVEPYLMHPFLMVRRSAIEAVGGYRHVFHAEDTDLYWRLLATGRLINLDAILGEYRVHPDSISSRSIVNGRVAAVSSQLAALSERRRRAGRPDLVFDRSLLAAYEKAAELESILAIASRGLSPDERQYLEIATAIKLLELSSYRAYRLTRTDLRTLRTLYERNYGSLSRRNRRYAVFKVILGRRRLRRDAMEAFRLIPWKIMPRATMDLGRALVGR